MVLPEKVSGGCVARLSTEAPTLFMTKIYKISYFELTCPPKHVLPKHVFRGATRQSVKIDVGIEKQKINLAGQGQPKHLNVWPVPCLKTLRIGSEKIYDAKILK